LLCQTQSTIDRSAKQLLFTARLVTDLRHDFYELKFFVVAFSLAFREIRSKLPIINKHEERKKNLVKQRRDKVKTIFSTVFGRNSLATSSFNGDACRFFR
jgi:hypothetical protein